MKFGRSRFTAFAFIAALGSTGITNGAAFAQPSNQGPAREVVAAACDSMKSTGSRRASDFSRIPDAPTQIDEATVVEANGKDPEYCRLRGYVAPQVGIELRLPVNNWNGKLLEVGTGGWAGYMFMFLCDGPLRKGYACISTDMGHKDGSGQALWAFNNLQAQVDYGFRATHVTALAGKAIVAAFYKRAPVKSLMLGCSTGGYQGIVESQLFPWDFDGIVAIAPDMTSEADVSMRIVWYVRAFTNADGSPVFGPADLRLLHDAALAQCDMTDGVRDGIVGDPLGCQFDPTVVVCRAGKMTGCLTPKQVDAAKKIYGGPRNSKGEPISTRGVLPGSELEWGGFDDSYAPEFFRYGVYMMSRGPDWQMRDFDFDQDYKRLGLAAIYSDNNPDLRKFKTSGAKLLVAQGGNDTAEIPGAVFDYYDTVERTMGGAAATKEFFRLFVVPGMKHCTAGDGAFAVDYLSYLERWVEMGQPPEKLVGAHVNSKYLLDHSEEEERRKGNVWRAAFRLVYPLDPAIPVDFTRTFYPYPQIAKYKGSGDPNDAANFVPTEPQLSKPP